VSSKFLAALVVGLCLAGAACSSEKNADAPSAPNEPGPGASADPSSAPTTAPPSGPTGSVGLSLVLPDGSGVNAVSWAITGPSGAATIVKSGSVNVHASGGTMFLVSQIPAGSGYRVVLSALSVDGGIACEGSASFTVTARATSQVNVQLGCNAAAGGGHTTLVNGTSFDCASWNSVTADPSETMTGTPVALAATATGPIPANLTYQWSAPSGQFGSASAASTTFTCTQPGAVQVTVVVGDGPVPAGSMCNPVLDTDVITITCSGMGPPPPPPPPVPATPPWGPMALALGLLGLGALGHRRTRASGG
jgi:hypothetical protein